MFTSIYIIILILFLLYLAYHAICVSLKSYKIIIDTVKKAKDSESYHKLPDNLKKPGRDIIPPSKKAIVFELFVVIEIFICLCAFPALLSRYKKAKSAKNSIVLVIPGFMTDDLATIFLRGFLSLIGFEVSGWGLGFNLYYNTEIRTKMGNLIDELYKRKNKKIDIIGWSLGGVYARELSRLYPDKINSVITLASPFTDGTLNGVSEWLHKIHVKMFDHEIGEGIEPELIANLGSKVPVPITAVYTKSDGVVSYKNCRVTEMADSHNIKVLGSHCGLGFNIFVYKILIKKLGFSTT